MTTVAVDKSINCMIIAITRTQSKSYDQVIKIETEKITKGSDVIVDGENGAVEIK